jgi:hypothetical protein
MHMAVDESRHHNSPSYIDEVLVGRLSAFDDFDNPPFLDNNMPVRQDCPRFDIKNIRIGEDHVVSPFVGHRVARPADTDNVNDPWYITFVMRKEQNMAKATSQIDWHYHRPS